MVEPYDVQVDTIICSKDFELCLYRNTEDSICSLENSKCWHISKCPAGYGRSNPNKTTAEVERDREIERMDIEEICDTYDGDGFRF